MLSRHRRAAILLCIAAGLLACGRSGSIKQGDSARGLSGAALQCTGKALGTTGIRRISQQELATTLTDVLGLAPGDVTADMFYPEAAGSEGFNNIAAAMTLSVDVFKVWADVLAKVLAKSPTVTNYACSGWDDCQTLVKTVGRRALSRELTTEFMADANALFTKLVGAGQTPKQALIDTLRMFFLSPEFVFRELPASPNLSPADVLRRLSFLIWNTPPDEALLAKIAGKSSVDASTLRTIVNEMLADPRGKRFARVFIDQWLRYSRIANIDAVPLNGKYPELTAEVREKMLRETTLFLEDLVGTSKPFSELLLANYTFADSALASYYGIDGVSGDFQKVSPSSQAAAGLLSQGSIVVGISGTRSTSPSRRGYWIMKNILCQSPPPVPNDIDPALLAELEAQQGLSTRDKLKVHAAAPQCSGCHIGMDNIGLSLESFDADARFRTVDAFGNPIDASGEIAGLGKFNNVQELASLFASGDQFRACVTKKLLIFAVGRDLAENDQCVVDAVAKSLTTQSTFADVIAEIALSNSFMTEGASAP